MRQPFPLSDREMIAKSLLGVRDYYRSVKNVMPFNVDDCINHVLETFKVIYREARGYRRRYDPLIKEDLREMSEIYGRIEDTLREEARKQAMSKASAIKARKISQISASSALRIAFQENGFTPEIIAQCYRAKVTVSLNKYSITVIIPYKVINEGKLDECLEHFKRIASSLETSPYEYQIRKDSPHRR